MIMIYLADYLPQNRNELSRWADGKSTFNWTPALKMIASVEGSGWLQLEEMEQYTKSKIRSIFHCNCHNKPSINAPKILQNNFDIVATILCLEYCCSSEIEYKEAVQNVVDQVKPGGWFLMGGVLEETWCSFGGLVNLSIFVSVTKSSDNKDTSITCVTAGLTCIEPSSLNSAYKTLSTSSELCCIVVDSKSNVVVAMVVTTIP
uniref:Uncharacterized protein n=1 Tax=Wuchereria bancrofti TaxID=6293 RepID=A0A1I8EVS5_WUCBA